MAYDNNMKGTLGKNKRKEKDTHPDYTGKCEIDGVEYWISGWIKENNTTHEKFFSLSFQEKDQQPQRSAPQRPASSGLDDLDDNNPF